MDYSDFLVLITRKGHQIVDGPFGSKQDESAQWVRYREVAELTKHIDFGCNFDESGMCKLYEKGERNTSTYTDEELRRRSCCCGGCTSSIGHMKYFPNEEKALRALAFAFDPKLGFWRRGGCVLPRKLRSPTCLTHYCGRGSMKAKPKSHALLTCLYSEKIFKKLSPLLADFWPEKAKKKQVFINALMAENGRI